VSTCEICQKHIETKDALYVSVVNPMLKYQGIKQIFQMLKIRSYHKSCFSHPYKKEIQDVTSEKYGNSFTHSNPPLTAMAGAFFASFFVGIISLFGGLVILLIAPDFNNMTLELLISPIAVVLGIYLLTMSFSLGISIGLNFFNDLKKMMGR
jgi:hypothetical protein